MIDLDNFKTINDDLPHCGRACRSREYLLALFACRHRGALGGDEFLAIVGNVKMEISRLAKPLCPGAETSIGSNNGRPFRCPFGRSGSDCPDETVEELSPG